MYVCRLTVTVRVARPEHDQQSRQQDLSTCPVVVTHEPLRLDHSTVNSVLLLSGLLLMCDLTENECSENIYRVE